MARIIEFFDGADSSTTPVIGNIVASNLVQYANDAAYEAAETGAPATGNIYYNTTDNTIRYYDGTQWRQVARNVDVVANTSDIADIRTTTGTADGDTNMGTYTGALINDNESTKQNIQQVETAVETNTTNIGTNTTNIGLNTADIADLRTTTGTSDGDTDYGTFTGSTLSDNSDGKVLYQELETAVEARIPSSEKGAANGVAELDGTGRMPASQLPTSATEYKGAWNASTNSPTLIDGTGTNGDLYRISVAGTQDLGSGSETYGVGDAVIYNGTIWEKIPADDSVASVNTQTGAVVLDTDDINEGVTNLYYTNARADARIAAASIDDLSDVDTTTTSPSLNDALTWTGSEWEPAATSGGGEFNYTDENTNYTAVANDFVDMDASGAARTVTLPTAVGIAGERIVVKKIDSSTNDVTIDGNGAQTIDGSTTIDLSAQNETLYMVSDGANWLITSRYKEASLQSSSSGLVSFPGAASTYVDLTSISLTKGTWDISAHAVYRSNGATSTTLVQLGINNVSGNTSPGTEGVQYVLTTKRNASGDRDSLALTRNGVFVTAATETWYLKGAGNSSVTNLEVAYIITARKI